MDRLDELTVLVAILDSGTLAAAARRLRRSPAAITRTLSALEARVGTRLLERTTRRMSPTEPGRELAENARHLLAAYAGAVLPRDTAIAGLLRITAPLVFGRRHVVPLALRFRDRHPDIRIDFLLSDRDVDLVEENVDLAIRIGAVTEAALVTRRLGEVSRVLVASPAYLSRRGAPARTQDLATHETIFVSGRPRPPEWRLRNKGRQTIIRLVPTLVVNDIESGLVAAREGNGIANFFSYQVEPDLRSGALIRLLPLNEPPPVPVQLVMPGGRHRPPRVRAFADFAIAELGRLALIRPQSGV